MGWKLNNHTELLEATVITVTVNNDIIINIVNSCAA